MIRERFMAPVDSASLAVFRVGFGAVSAWEALHFLDDGRIREIYLEPDFLFTWWLFDWVKPHHGFGVYLHFVLLVVAGLLVAAGLFYRWAAIVQFLGMTYFFLLDKAPYLNHRYLACLFAFLLIVAPAHSAYSLDARRKPWVRSATVPAWSVALLRFQVGVPYFFAGVAKLNFDWLFRAEPLRAYLLVRTDFPLIGRFFPSEPFIWGMAIGSAALDLTAPFLLLHRRTRVAAYGLTLVFHLINARLFNIGIFPWMMIVATTVFFDPDWPRRLAATLRTGGRSVRAAIVGGFAVGFVLGGFLPHTFSAVKAAAAGFGVAVLVFHVLPQPIRKAPCTQPAASAPWRRFVSARPLAWFLAIWVAIQILVPLRHLLYPGNTHWTEEGHRFSWNLLVREKRAFGAFYVTDRSTGERWIEDPSIHLHQDQIDKLFTKPDLMVQFAHYLERYYREQSGIEDLEIRVESQVGLNTRVPQELVDPDVDLTTIGRPYILPADWIVPLEPYQ